MNKSQDLYQTTRMRLTKCKNTKEKYISDKEIIEKLAIEIQQYRERIEKLNKTISPLFISPVNFLADSPTTSPANLTSFPITTKGPISQLAGIIALSSIMAVL